MSIIRRIALLLRSYLSAASDRLDAVAREEERREAESLRKALEELRSAADSGELKAERGTSTTIGAPSSGLSTQLAADYRLLGVTPGADLTTVEAAWRSLASRADPKRFPAGSEEEKRAGELLKSINAAYARIREALNPTEGRFGRLEL